MILSASIPLGRDNECESCGPSYNMIAYDYDTVTDIHKVASHVGCIGGGMRRGSAGDAVNFLCAYRDWPGGDGVQELITWLAR